MAHAEQTTKLRGPINEHVTALAWGGQSIVFIDSSRCRSVAACSC